MRYKSMRKQIFSLLVIGCLAISFVVSMPTYACDDNIGIDEEILINTTNNEIVPYAAVCGACKKGTMVTTTTWGAWVISGSTACKHHVYGNDYTYTRTGTKTTKCNVCAKGTATTVKESKTECKGHDTP